MYPAGLPAVSHSLRAGDPAFLQSDMFTTPIDETYLLTSNDLLNPFDYTAIFGRTCPVEIEIGVGKGRFLLDEAVRRPDTGFLGIERVRKYLRMTHLRLNELGCENVRLICEDAGYVIRQLVVDNSIAAYHVYFPDPWPKRKHHKRRIIQPDFVRHLYRTLIPSGVLRICTDHEQYAHHIDLAVKSLPEWEEVRTWSEMARTEESSTATHFEVKYSREKRMVYWTECCCPNEKPIR